MNEPEKKSIPIAEAEAAYGPTPDSEAPTVPLPVEPVASAQPVPPVEPVAASVSPAPSLQPEPKAQSGGVLVLQWLTYAFWFWFAMSLTWLAGVVINFFVAGSASSGEWGGTLAYPLASVIIMLIIALVTDFFYGRHEPAKKVGGANVIMLLHVVPFVLFAIGALVTIVFAALNMTLNSSPFASTDGPLQVMLVALVSVVLLGLAATRAFFGSKPRVRLVTRVAFVMVALGFIVAGVAGPAVEAVRTKNDRLIERALPLLASDIREYASMNDRLPDALKDVTHSSSYDADVVQLAIDSGLVTYKPNTVPADDGSSYTPEDDSYSSGSSYSLSNNVKRFYYQLCTTYSAEKKSRYNYDNGATYTTKSDAGVAADYRYSGVSSISSHPAGNVCYNLYADGR